MNWNLPTLTSLYTDVIDLMKERTEDVATMFRSSTSTNIPTGSIRWSDTNSRFESWNGSAWVELDALYEMQVRDAVGLSTARTISLSGDATGSTTFDGTANKTISLSLTASQVLAKLKTVDGSGSGLDADTVDGVGASQFLRSDISDTTTGNITISNNNPSLILVDTGTSNPSNQSIRLRHNGIDLELPNGEGLGFIIDTTDTTGSDLTPAVITTGQFYADSDKQVWHSGNDGSGSGLDADLLDGKHATAFNQVIGTDSDMNTSGATIPDRFYFTDGVCTSHGTRTLTASDLGVTDYDAAHSFSSNGYQKLANGLIFQWGSKTTTSSGYTTINFPIAFNSVCSYIQPRELEGQRVFNIKNLSATSFEFESINTPSYNMRWFAIGY